MNAPLELRTVKPAPRFVFTRHAVERFRQRHAAHLVSREAEALLKTLVPRAVKLDEKSFYGQDQWLVDEPEGPRVVFLTKNDPAVGVVIVTVLTHEMRAPTREELDELADAARRLEPSYVAATTAVPAPPPPPPLTTKAQERAAKKAATAEKEAERARERAKQKAINIARDAERQAAALASRNAPRSEPPSQVARLREHAVLHETRANEDRQITRLALRALRPLIGTDLGAALAWEAIGAFRPTYIKDAFIDYERPVKVAPVESTGEAS